MGSDLVVLISPAIECRLTGRQRIEALPAEQFELQSAMETFIFALRLRMMGPAVTDLDT